MAMDPQDMAMQAQMMREQQEDPSLETSPQFDPTMPQPDPSTVPPGAPAGPDMGGLPPELLQQLAQDPAMLEQAMQDPQLGPLLQQMGGGQVMPGQYQQMQPPNPYDQIQQLHLQASASLLQGMIYILSNVEEGKKFNLDVAAKSVQAYATSYKTLMDANNQKEEIPPELQFQMEQAKLENQLKIEEAKLQIEQERAKLDLEIKRAEADLKLQTMYMDMDLKQQQAEANLQMKSQESQLKLQQQDEQHFQNLSQQQEQHSQQLSMQEEQQKMQAQQAKDDSSE